MPARRSSRSSGSLASWPRLSIQRRRLRSFSEVDPTFENRVKGLGTSASMMRSSSIQIDPRCILREAAWVPSEACGFSVKHGGPASVADASIRPQQPVASEVWTSTTGPYLKHPHVDRIGRKLIGIVGPEFAATRCRFHEATSPLVRCNDASISRATGSRRARGGAMHISC